MDDTVMGLINDVLTITNIQYNMQWCQYLAIAFMIFLTPCYSDIGETRKGVTCHIASQQNIALHTSKTQQTNK